MTVEALRLLAVLTTGLALGAWFARRRAPSLALAAQDPAASALVALSPLLLSAREHRLARRVQDLAIGVCEIDRNGKIVEIDGGALKAAGQTRDQWIGVDIRQTDLYREAFEAAQDGRTVPFADDIGTGTQVVLYSPRGDLLTGEPDGALCIWLALPDSCTAEVSCNV